jgi:membrane protein implicated in regulation of membrane protease activity
VSRLAGILIALAAVGGAALFFWLGLIATGENDEVVWAVRGPLWGVGAAFLLIGVGTAFLAVRSDPR